MRLLALALTTCLVAPALAQAPKVGDPPEAHNMRLVGMNDLQGRSAYQPTIHRQGDRYIAYIGHHGGTPDVPKPINKITGQPEFNGTSILDVTDPANPKYLKHLPGLEGNYEEGGAQMVRVCDGRTLPKADPAKTYMLRVFGGKAHEIWDVSDAANPSLITRLESGRDTHKNWWECDTGIAYLVSGISGWRVRRMTQIYDLSDPAKPVPYLTRPVRFGDSDRWKSWLVTDQRAVADRTDVLTYETPKLTAPVRISGAPVADLVAATTGTDADWVVKLIDVYPDEVPGQPEMGGYQLGVSMDIFRGRYRESFEHPSPIPAGKPQRYRFALPTTNHVFLPGHRIMVQIQSSWFPLYDRNPQTFVPSIFWAKAEDYKKAVQRVYHTTGEPSQIILPLVATP